MSKPLEKWVREHREEFDELEPSPDLWAKIEARLPSQFNEPKKKEAKMFSLGFVLRVAAAIIVLMSVLFVTYLRNIKKDGIDLAAINPAYAKQQIHYTS